eukprot:2416402-Rhodomonas_salina.3
MRARTCVEIVVQKHPGCEGTCSACGRWARRFYVVCVGTGHWSASGAQVTGQPQARGAKRGLFGCNGRPICDVQVNPSWARNLLSAEGGRRKAAQGANRANRGSVVPGAPAIEGMHWGKGGEVRERGEMEVALEGRCRS